MRISDWSSDVFSAVLRARAIVHQLLYRSSADRADMARLIADLVEHRPVALEHRLIAADPDLQLAGGGAARAAADRRVHHVRALLRQDRKSTRLNSSH